MQLWQTGSDMEQKAMNLRTLTMDELAGVVNLYPWYSAARKELCRRMSGIGGESWGVSQFADQAMYISDRRSVAEIMADGAKKDYSDKNLESLLKSYIAEDDKREVKTHNVRVPGGDFFSQSEYEKVKRVEDNVFSRFQAKKKPSQEDSAEDLSLEFCTASLAEIYSDQGYYDQAKRIYRKLILAFPEKSAYFASLIDKIDKQINNQTL